jgi:flagellar protein FliO/FliZ
VNGFALEFVSLMVSLTLVLGAAFVFLRVLKRFQPGGEQSAELAFMRAVPIGPRERIVLMRWRDEVLLLGVSAGAITLIAKAPAPVNDAKDTDIMATPEPPPPGGAGVGRGDLRAVRPLAQYVALISARHEHAFRAARVLTQVSERASALLRDAAFSIRDWSRLVRSRMRPK